MRGVSISDVHLGFRRHAAQVNGRNAREVDVEQAWFRAVENAVDASPDLVTLCGDLFHHPRVGTAAELAFRDGVRRLAEVFPVVILQGNHDATKTAASRSPIHIPADYEDVYVVTEPRRIRITAESTGESVAIACFPYVDLAASDEAFKVDPDPKAEVNVLCLHGAAKASEGAEALPYFYAGDRALDIGREAGRWDAICCGDYHDFHRLSEEGLAFYSGAIERTSSDVWEEDEKGIVVYDTVTEQMVFTPHETREHYYFRLGEFFQGGRTDPEAVCECLFQLTTREDLEDTVVRVQVPDFPRGRRQEIDWQLVRELKATCLHFQLDLRWAEGDSVLARDRRDGDAEATIEEDARSFFEGDEPEIRDTALDYLGVEPEDEDEPVTEERPAVAAGGAR